MPTLCPVHRLSPMKKPHSIKIKSVHANLADAVEASGIDLSYNEGEAQRDIALIDNGYRGARSVAGLVADDGRIFYVYGADIPLLNEFEPFSSCLDDSPLTLVYYSPANAEIVFTDAKTDKSGPARKMLAKGLRGKAELLGPLFTSCH